MTLSFQKSNVENYNFIEKIWNGLLRIDFRETNSLGIEEYYNYTNQYFEKFGQNWYGYGTHISQALPKIHTIREDDSNRWKTGNKIHFAINNRTKNRFQFAPVLKCLSVQKVFIEHEVIGLCRWARVYIDGALYGTAYWAGGHTFDCDPKLKRLALNDGFDSVKGFFEYFNNNFQGKIIHWTNLKY